MNLLFDWPTFLVTALVCIALFWWTLRTATRTWQGRLVKALVLFLLVAFSGIMLLNAMIYWRLR